MITPRTLKGFRDLMPGQAHRREAMVHAVTETFHRHGYLPIETPALEYAEIIKGKGGEESDKQLYEWTDAGGRQVALRFDLTVPLARYVAEHQGQLVFPFRRYHVGPVWRGERPQKGRYREFMQCDADIVGAVGDASDAEMLVVVGDAYRALDVGDITIRFNDRRVLQGLLERIGAVELATPVLRALDKLDKQGEEPVLREMTEAGLSEADAKQLLAATMPRASDGETLLALQRAVAGSEIGEAGVGALERVRGLALAAGTAEQMLQVDPRIARGLDYYTGIVFEARFKEAPEFGSVGGGGRYDDLAGLYTKAALPGVGGSVGIDRLLAALEESEGGLSQVAPSDVLITYPESDQLELAFRAAGHLRGHGLRTEVYPERKKHGAQMRYADRQGIRFVLTLDEDGTLHGKDLKHGQSFEAKDAIAAVQAMRRRGEAS